MKDTKTILLVLLSVGIVATWVYHLYDKTKYTKAQTAIEVKDPAASVKDLQDSLQRVYSSAVNDLGAQLDSAKSTAGLLQGELIAKLDEINMLKTEIADLLRKTNVKKEDIDLAGRKTTKFQQLVADLPKNGSASNTSASPGNSNPAIASTTPASTPPSTTPNASTPPGTQTSPGSSNPVFTASDLKFTPIKVTDDKEEETSEAGNASKLIISFAVKNNIADFSSAEVFAIITQPDGKVMQTDLWESASISTHEFGKKTYTRKVRFEYQKGETKHLQLTLKPEDYEKGNYRLQVFHNGYLIGETTRRLN